MAEDEKNERYRMGSEDPHCPMRRMLAEALVRQRAPDWQSASDADRQWAQDEALKIQKSHEEVARSMGSSTSRDSGPH